MDREKTGSVVLSIGNADCPEYMALVKSILARELAK